MANIIAVIWDCDKTLIDGYMQDPIFDDYGIEAKPFWDEVSERVEQLSQNNIRVNRDTYYLNYFIECAHNGRLHGLSNERLRGYGAKQKFYKGIPEIFEKTKKMFIDDKTYSEYGIQVEHYIVSTGFAEIIRGTKLMEFVDDIWGCCLLYTSFLRVFVAQCRRRLFGPGLEQRTGVLSDIPRAIQERGRLPVPAEHGALGLKTDQGKLHGRRPARHN